MGETVQGSTGHTAGIETVIVPSCSSASAVRGGGGEAAGNFRLPPLTVGEQLVLVVEKLFAAFGGVLDIRSLDDGVHRAGVLEQAGGTENAAIRKSTECTGLRAEMTITPDVTVTKANR